MSDRPSLVVVRHGATEWSESGRHTGRTDLPLVEAGRERASRLAAVLAGHDFALALTSPLQRARTTCELAGFADRAQVDDDLLELDYGAYEGRTTTDIRRDDPGWTLWTHPVPGGETLAQVGTRADRVIARALDADGDVVLFGHGHMLRILIARWCDLDPVEGRRFALGTATSNLLGWEHEYRTIRMLNGSAF